MPDEKDFKPVTPDDILTSGGIIECQGPHAFEFVEAGWWFTLDGTFRCTPCKTRITTDRR